MAAEAVLSRSYKLKEREGLKQVNIRRNMTEEERLKIKELINEAKKKKNMQNQISFLRVRQGTNEMVGQRQEQRGKES